MNKNYKRCPRCRARIPTNFGRCGECGLNFKKFEDATNLEAKSAFRMGEKERVLHTTHIPSDVNKIQALLLCMFGGWIGLHYFKIGKLWRGALQIIGFIFGLVYSYVAVQLNVRAGYLGALLLVGGIIWASTVIIWITDTISIIFNKFKYPVSLPYSNTEKGE